MLKLFARVGRQCTGVEAAAVHGLKTPVTVSVGIAAETSPAIDPTPCPYRAASPAVSASVSSRFCSHHA
ncbi:hypothetical protein GCM10007242_04980 [Pigmentiphaga litoralis]|nr:hypothetical protein GCM10007242_04980 [Pigmentiphaga litoralis]